MTKEIRRDRRQATSPSTTRINRHHNDHRDRERERESIDVSEDGNVTFEEFVRLTSGKLKSDDEKTLELEEALKVFDKLGQG